MTNLTYELHLLTRTPELSAIAIFPPAFPGFQGHFPTHRGGPLLPGFMQLQLAMDLLHAAGVTANLKAVTAAKFITPITPNMKVKISLITHPKRRYTARITADNNIYGTFEFLLE